MAGSPISLADALIQAINENREAINGISVTSGFGTVTFQVRHHTWVELHITSAIRPKSRRVIPPAQLPVEQPDSTGAVDRNDKVA